MNIRLKKDLAVAIGVKKFVEFNCEADTWHSYTTSADIDLECLNDAQLAKLEALFVENKDVNGAKRLISDIQIWRKAMVDTSKVKARNVRQFEPILIKHLLELPNHWVYRDYGDEGTFLPYYVGNVEYHPPSQGRANTRPAYVEMNLWYNRFGGRKSIDVTFWEEDCRGLTADRAMARKGFYIETPEFNAKHKAEVLRFNTVCHEIGKQYLADGVGRCDVDGNDKSRNESWWHRAAANVELVRNGEPTRTVIDVFYEESQDERDRDDYVSNWFWENKRRRGVLKGTTEEDADIAEDELNDTEEVIPKMRIPIHPFLVVFDLSKHKRLRVHINQLTEYVYDPKLVDKLILPEDQKALVKLLVSGDAGSFTDIIKGKSGGAIVLLTGKPGTGKTLTAEVFAESEGRALYSVQCSQLGTDPDALEEALLKVFIRAKRWNAVLLLDEADVYVHERGQDMQQNAIVGVFLRVLEYMSSVMFLTSNRPEDIDDAIASRCIARLNYVAPGVENQKRIWRVLSDGAGIKIAKADIARITQANLHLSGRDVKNLLKLAALLQQGKPVTPEAIQFVKQFKPTGG